MRSFIAGLGVVALGIVAGCSAEADGPAAGGDESNFTATTEAMTGRYVITPVRDMGDSAGRVVTGKVTLFEAGVADFDKNGVNDRQYGFLLRQGFPTGAIPTYTIGHLVRRNVPIDQPTTAADKAKPIFDTSGKELLKSDGKAKATRADLWNAYATTNMIDLALDSGKPYELQSYLVRGTRQENGKDVDCLGASAARGKQCERLFIAGPVAHTDGASKCPAGAVRMYNAGGFCLPAEGAQGGAKWYESPLSWSRLLLASLDNKSPEACLGYSYFNGIFNDATKDEGPKPDAHGDMPDFRWLTTDTVAIGPDGQPVWGDPGQMASEGKVGLPKVQVVANLFEADASGRVALKNGKATKRADKAFFFDAVQPLAYDALSSGGTDVCGLTPAGM